MFKLKIEKRPSPSPWIKFQVSLGSIFLALLVSSIILLLLGLNPLNAFLRLFFYPFLTLRGIERIIIKAIPLLIVSIGLSVAFRAKIWNIGAPGQMVMGAIVATGIGLFLFPNLPSFILLSLMFSAGFVAGAGIAIICALLNIKIDLNMVVSTLLLNYVASEFLGYLLYGPWGILGFPYTKELPPSAQLPTLGRGNIPYPTLILAILLTVGTYFLLSRTKWGYEIKVFGQSREAARYAGISKSKITMLVTTLSGGLSGLAGVGELTGLHHALVPGITGAAAVYTTSYGYTAIFIAWLGRNHPIGVLVATFFIAIILIGGQGLQLIGVPYAVVSAIIGLMLLILMGGVWLTKYKITVNGVKEGEEPQ